MLDQSKQQPERETARPRRQTPSSFVHSRLMAGTAAVAIVALGLAAFAFMPHEAADNAAARGPLQQVAMTEENRPAPRLVQPGGPFSFADLVERVAPSVVTVTVDVKEQNIQPLADRDIPDPLRQFFHDFQGPQPQAPRKAVVMGSGFIIDSAGYIVTNNHVVQNGQKISVKLKDGRTLQAHLIGTDPATDVALIKVDAGKPLPAVEFANDRSVRAGDWVIAVGDPFGLSNTVTAGIVSSLGRDIGAGNYTDYIQIDAPINQGNSGGPAFDIEGKVIGMNTLIYSPSGGSVGIGFAIPSSTVHDIVAQLKAHGTVARGWLGVEIQNFTPDMAASVGDKNAQGAIVAQVVPDGPAARAGFRQGDVVLAVNGAAVSDARDVTRRVAEIPAGSEAHFSVLRNGQKTTLTAKIGARPAQQMASNGGSGPRGPAPSTAEAMGLGLAGLTPDLRRMYNVDNGARGVLITKVDPDSDAAEKGIQPGDVILAIANQLVTSPQQVQDGIARAKQQGRDSVLALVLTQGGQRFVALGVGKG